MRPIGPNGPIDSSRITVRSKMWTPSSFSVAINKHPFSGSWMVWAHFNDSPVAPPASSGEARCWATSLARNDRQSESEVRNGPSSSCGDPRVGPGCKQPVFEQRFQL